MTLLAPLPDLIWEPIVRTGLLEDLGIGGDLTCQSVIAPQQRLRGVFRARQSGVLAGLAGARLSFALLDHSIVFQPQLDDGARLAPGTVIATVEGTAQAILGGERVSLNLLSHLSGIASTTRAVVDAVADTHARICCTRKTLPGLRAIQKYAVRAGGGSNHRYRLDDAVLIKDNHLALAGSIANALQQARERAGHLTKIELEVDRLEQLQEALENGGADAYLLDNMDATTLRKAVRIVDGRALTEASGGITPETASAVAASGVDILSLGWLTHSVKALDIGLDIEA